jgi:diadenosine tetraphosphate (Ap4A) HIT family hydrolase
MDCELCNAETALFSDDNAFVRYDNNSLSKGHVLVVPRRHVADFFEMTWPEKTSIIALLDRAKARMHVHIHLIPRYVGDVSDPSGGIRCVLSRRPH